MCHLIPDPCGSVGWASSHRTKCCQFDSGQGTCLGYGPVPGWGTSDRQPIDVSLPFFLSLLPSLWKNKFFKKMCHFIFDMVVTGELSRIALMGWNPERSGWVRRWC